MTCSPAERRVRVLVSCDEDAAPREAAGAELASIAVGLYFAGFSGPPRTRYSVGASTGVAPSRLDFAVVSRSWVSGT